MSITDIAPDARPAAAKRVNTHDLSTALRVGVARLSRRLRAEKADNEVSDAQYT